MNSNKELKVKNQVVKNNLFKGNLSPNLIIEALILNLLSILILLELLLFLQHQVFHKHSSLCHSKDFLLSEDYKIISENPLYVISEQQNKEEQCQLIPIPLLTTINSACISVQCYCQGGSNWFHSDPGRGHPSITR